MITPLLVQPEVPKLMPKVWLPNVPLVVDCITCGAMSFWFPYSPQASLPRPQPGPVSGFGAAQTCAAYKGSRATPNLSHCFLIIIFLLLVVFSMTLNVT